MDNEWIEDPAGSTLRVGDLVRYRDSVKVGPTRFVRHVSEFGFTVADLPAVWMPRDYSTAIDPVIASTRWQYHAPTRAKLEAADRESAAVASITSDAITAQTSPPPDSEPNEQTFPDGCKPLMHFVPGEIVAPVDPFAALRAEAKRMMDDGADPRLVLGALDECVTSGRPSTWNSAVAAAVVRYSAEAIEYSMSAYRQRRNGPCYHGNRAGTCGWCALSRDRSDARVAASHEPAWETADCEGE